MTELYLKNQDEFTHEFESFLANVRSILDVMLEDFNKKFRLGISLTEDLYPSTFEKRARQQGNQEAMAFISWWKTRMAQVKSSYVGPLFEKRDISIHRKTVAPDLKKINLIAKDSTSLTITVHDANGNLVAQYSGKKPEVDKPEPPKVDWSFTDYPDDNALDVSKKLLDAVQKMLLEARKQFEK